MEEKDSLPGTGSVFNSGAVILPEEGNLHDAGSTAADAATAAACSSAE